MIRPLEKATPDDYRLLGLQPGAEPEKVKHAFRHLVKQWHPDRHQQRSALEQHQAEERFKSIATAYRRIVAGWDPEIKKSRTVHRGRGGAPGNAAGPSGSSATKTTGDSVRAGETPPLSRPAVLRAFRRPLLWIPRSWPGRIPKSSWIVLGILFLLVNLAPWEHLSTPVAPLKSMPDAETSVARNQWPMQDHGGEEASGGPMHEAKDRSIPINPEKGPLLSHGRLPSTGSERSTFSLGATPEEVLRIQGTPDRIRGQTWIYGLSEISFKDGGVARYHNFGGELRVQMAPSSQPPVPPPQWFTLGTTSDEVLWVQGTPTRVEGSKWYYGFSEISFKNGRVEGFDNYFGILKVRMLPSSSAVQDSPRSHFTVGSSKDEVLAVQGTPTSIRGNVWFYQFSNVLFRNGKVQNAVDTAGVLRFVLPEESAQKK